MDFYSIIRDKYSYLKDSEIDLLINRAKSILIDQLYPADLTIDYITYDIPNRFNLWIIDCVDELIERAGFSSYVSYSENGVSFKFSGDGSVSKALLARLPRMVGTVR